MAFRLVPRDQGFFPLFDALAADAVECGEKVQAMFRSLPASASLVEEIENIERRADTTMKTIRERLEAAIITPFDREDIQAVANYLDDVVDEMRAAADLALLHNVNQVLPGISEMVDILVDAVKVNQRLVSKLSTLRNVNGDVDEIDALEARADRLHRHTVAELFNGKHDALEVLRWRDVVEAVEKAVNAVEDVSDVIQAIAVKHA